MKSLISTTTSPWALPLPSKGDRSWGQLMVVLIINAVITIIVS